MPNNITTYNQTPYVDDFQSTNVAGEKTPEEKNYLRILYKPGVSVQARELNQMQSMLQSQIDSLGRSTFEDGAPVVAGEKQFDDKIYAVDVDLSDAIFVGVNRTHYLDNLTTLQYQVNDSPVVVSYINATVLKYEELASGNVRFFIRYDNTYQDASANNVESFPMSGGALYYAGENDIKDPVSEELTDVELSGRGSLAGAASLPPTSFFPIQNSGSIGSIVATHQAVIAKVDTGVFFVKGEFVLSDEQSIYLVKPENDYLVNGKLAFRVNENIITPADDDDLYDNAQGYPNFKAPGADRYSIELELIFLSEGYTSANDIAFVEDNKRYDDIENKYINCISLADINEGDEIFSFIQEIEDGKDRIGVSEVLGDNIVNTLAQRTDEESGDYAVEPFVIDVREYYNDIDNSENRGLYTEQQIRDAGITVKQGDISGIVPTTADVIISDGTTQSDVVKYGESRFSIGIEPSVAYVEGFRVEAKERIDIPVEKARRTEENDVDAVVTAELGSYIEGGDEALKGTPQLGIDVTQSSSGATAKVRGIEKVGDKFRLYVYNVSGSFNDTDNITGPSFAFEPSSTIIETAISQSFITLPYQNISNVDAAECTFKMREMSTGTVAGDTVIIDATTNSDQRIFTDESGESYIIQKGTAGAADNVIIPQSASIPSVDAGRKVILNLSSGHGLVDSSTVNVLNSFEITIAAKTKTSSNGTKTFTNTLDDTFSGLGKVDAYEIVSAIYFSDDSSPANGVLDEDASPPEVAVDITSDIELDDGQRDGIYKESKVRYTGGIDLSDKTVIITFKYFSRGGLGSFYSKNSYAAATIDYEDIPSYRDIRLSDILDFRGDESGFQVNGLTTFFDPNSVVEAKVNYYLNRIDVVIVNTLGEFKVIQGTPGLYPNQPSIPDNAMHLYTVNVPAYTFDIKDIDNEYIDNRRYTMRDIGELESRIKNIEYFQTMSLLEQDANQKDIVDGVTNMDRFKNGIVVDSFLGHGTADTLDPGCLVSIDKVEGLMRPTFSESNDRFVLTNPIQNGIHPDGMATLPIDYSTDEVTFINQDKASVHMSVNPYAVAAWWGELKLSPSSDQWKETSQRPDVIVNRENDAAVLRNIRNAVRAQGTQWGSWRTNWVGRFRWTRTSRWRRRGRGRRLFIGSRFGRSVRVGLRTTASIETVRSTVNNKIVDTSFVPFIRSRRVYFTGKLFRPNTKLHLYFDGVDISSYATKAPFVEFKNNRDTRNFLNQDATQIFTSLGARQELITDESGSITGYFVIPNNSANKFRTGEREVILNDSAIGAKADDSTTSASVDYSATGVVQHRQRTVVSTRRVRFRRDWVVRRRNIRIRRRRWRDPLAQSFMIGEIETGLFATSVDLYFQRKSNSVPVQMYVVTTDNGYPSQEIIPGSEITLMPEEVNIDDEKATAATNFRFDSPIYLSPGVEYAIVVLSNDDNYRMWLSDIGKEDVNGGGMIVKNPYTGVMFKSQNASTWTADQNKDFKFKMNRAKFATQTKEYNFDVLLSDDSPAPAPTTFSQLMLQSEDVNLPQTSVRYQLSIDGTNYVDIEAAEEYYEGGTIDSNIKLKATLSSTSDFVTPLLDLDRLSLAGVGNIVNGESALEVDGVDTELDANHGTAEARYITQEISLANAADQITTYLDINRPSAGSNVRVYIRTKTGEESISENTFIRVLPKNGNAIPVSGDRDEFNEVEFEAPNLDLFSSFQLKIVICADDAEYVPVVKSLRSVATT